VLLTTAERVSLLPTCHWRIPCGAQHGSGFVSEHLVPTTLRGPTERKALPHGKSHGEGSVHAKLSSTLENLRNVLAIELLAACQGIEFLAPLATGPRAQKAQQLVRSVSRPVDKDRSLSADIAAVANLIQEGEFQRVLRDALRTEITRHTPS
jgi:hypothetical protein